MTLKLTVISDAICPWCWIGKKRLDDALAILRETDPELSFDVGFFPFMLNADMPEEGVEREAWRASKFGSVERSRELDADVAKAGASSGLEFRHAAIERTPNTTNAHRLSRFAAEAGCQRTVMEAIFRAYFHEGRDIGKIEVLADIAAASGMDRARVHERLASREGAAEVRAEAEAASRAGINGVPTFVLNRHIVFSGAQAPETMAEVLRKAARNPEVLEAAE